MEEVMLKRLMMIGLLGISVVAILAAEASAQISGWGWTGFSSINGLIDTIHTPPPQTHPSQLLASVTGHFQIACVNPATNGIFNGKSFTTTASGSVLIKPADITDSQGGKATTPLTIDLTPLEIPANCTNPNWQPKSDSAMAFDFSGFVCWCLTDPVTLAPECSPAPDCTPTTKKGLIDKKFVSCTLDTTDPLNQRNADGTAPGGAKFDCNLP
jgi:hypothetical protein